MSKVLRNSCTHLYLFYFLCHTRKMKKHLQVNILMFQWRDERNVFMRRQSSVFRFGHCHTNFNRSCKK